MATRGGAAGKSGGAGVGASGRAGSASGTGGAGAVAGAAGTSASGAAGAAGSSNGGGGSSVQGGTGGNGGSSAQSGAGGGGGASGAGGLTSGPLPTTCSDARGVVGCCGPNNTVYWYDWPDATNVRTRACPGGTFCAWDEGSQDFPSFGCLAKPGADPSGAIPYACGPGTLLPGACSDTAHLACDDPRCNAATVGKNAVCTVYGECAECNERADCPPNEVCGDYDRCVAPECVSDSDCSGTRPACDPTIGRCRRCLNDSHCQNEPLAPHCSKTGNECECATDSECAGSTDGKRCVFGSCQCEDAADCGADRPICPGEKGVPARCEACTVDWECAANAAKPFCIPDEAGYRCSACRVDADCDAPDKPLCSADFVCVAGCRNAFDCPASAPTCAADATGVPQCGSSVCAGDDAFSGKDDHPTTTERKLVPGVSVPGAVCPQSGDFDWFEVVVAPNATVKISVTGDDPGLLLVVANETGREEGLALHGTPRVVRLTHLPAGKHFVGVATQSEGGVAQAYSVLAETTLGPPCNTRIDCAADPDTQFLRGVCEGTTGSCLFAEAAGSVAVGGACDQDADCFSGLCSYTPFAAGQGTRAFCTTSCVGPTANGPEPLDIYCPEDALCQGDRAPIFPCGPVCTSDAQCPVRLDASPVTGAWSRWSCEAGRCFP